MNEFRPANGSETIEQTIDRVYKEHWRTFIVCAYRVLQNETDAEDVVQDYFEKLIEQDKAIFDGKKDMELVGMFCHIIIYRARTQLARKKRLREIPLEESLLDIPQGPTFFLLQFIEQLKAHLNEKEVKVFMLAYIDRIEEKEIANELKIKEKQVYEHTKSIRKKLEKYNPFKKNKKNPPLVP